MAAEGRYRIQHILTKQSCFEEACMSGNTELLIQLLKDPEIDVNLAPTDGVVPLHHTACHPWQFAKILFQDTRTDVNAEDKWKRTFLHRCICTENVDWAPNLENILSEKRLNPAIGWDNYKDSVLFAAISKGDQNILNSLLHHEKLKELCQPSALDQQFGISQLHYVCLLGDLASVNQLLTDPEINPNETNHFGETPLHFATKFGHVEIVAALLNDPRVDPELYDESSYTPLHTACNKGRFEIAQLLLTDSRHIDPNAPHAGSENPPICVAICTTERTKAAAQIVSMLLSHPKISTDWVAKHYLKFDILQEACYRGNADCVKVLLNDPRFDPTIRSHRGDSCLSLAAESGKPETVKLLLADRRVNPNGGPEETRSVFTNLQYQDRPDIVQILLDDGRVDPNGGKQEFSGRNITFIRCAACKGKKNLVRTLLQNPDIEREFMKSIRNNSLLRACATGEADIVRTLLQNPAYNVNVTDVDLIAPIHFASALKDTEILELLIQHPNIEPNLRRKHLGDTPLHIACSQGNLKAVEILLSHPNTHPNYFNSIDLNPFAEAAIQQDWYTIKYMLQYPIGSEIVGEKDITLCKLMEYFVAPDIIDLVLTDSRFKTSCKRALITACKDSNIESACALLVESRIDRADEELFRTCMNKILKQFSKSKWVQVADVVELGYELCKYSGIPPDDLISEENIAAAVAERFRHSRSKSARK